MSGVHITPAERRLGIPPLPERPEALRDDLDKLDTLLERTVAGTDSRATGELAELLDELRNPGRSALMSIELRREIEVRSGVAHNWLGLSAPDLRHLDLALDRLRSARGMGDPTRADLVRIDTAAAATLLRRFERAGDVGDLNDATRIAERAYAAAPDGSALHGRAALILATVLFDGWRRDGDTRLLERSIDLLEGARRGGAGTQVGDVATVQLASLLHRRYDVGGSIDDLQRGIALLRGPGNCLAVGRAGTLAQLLRSRFLRLGNPADIDEAIELFSPGGADETLTDPARLTNLGNALLSRHGSGGEIDDLDRAVRAQRRAIEATPQRDWQLASRWNNLGNALSTAALTQRDLELVREAVAAYSSALALTNHDAPERSSRELNLARARLDSATLDGDADSAGTAVAAAVAGYRRAVEAGLDGSLEWALRAAIEWAGIATRQADRVEAATAFAHAETVLERLVDAQLLRSEKLAWLGQASSVFANAAWARWRGGSAVDAVLAADRGRALLLREELAQRESDVATLRAAGHHGLVDRYLAARRRWSTALDRGA